MALSTTPVLQPNYKYDLNIICRCDEKGDEPTKVDALRQDLVSRRNFNIYGKPQHVLGQTMFKAHGEGLEQSR